LTHPAGLGKFANSSIAAAIHPRRHVLPRHPLDNRKHFPLARKMFPVTLAETKK